MAFKTIVLTGSGDRYERAAAAGLYPGHIVEITSSNTVQKHSKAGGRGELLVATEDALQGNTITTAYATSDTVFHRRLQPGDLFQGRVPANCPALVIGDELESDGGGCLVKPIISQGILSEIVAPSTAITNTVSTEQDFDTTYTVPANSLRVGDIIRIKGHAVVSATAGADFLTVKLYIGSQLVATITGIDAVTSDTVNFDCYIQVRTIGGSGTMVADVSYTIGATNTATTKHAALASVTLVTTAAKIIKASATWSGTTSACTAALQSFTVSLQRLYGDNVLARVETALDNSAVAAEAFVHARVA